MNDPANQTDNFNRREADDPRSSPVAVSPPPPAPDLRAGAIINDRYEVIEVIGRGAIGTVYRVEQRYLKKQYAMKVLNGLIHSSNTTRRFQNEALAASRLDHPGIAKAVDFGLIDGHQPFFVMELLEGQTLARQLRKQGRMSLSEAIEMFVPILEALDHAHSNGIVHRDIKPSNIVLTRREEDGQLTAKVVDFGIAKVELDESTDGTPLTKTGEVFGTPLYMSPEQCAGNKVDARSDIYSLGCVLFEALTGSPPFNGDTALKVMMQHDKKAAPSLKEASLGESFPASIETVMAKFLAKQPDGRYQNCLIAAHDLRLIMKDEFVAASAGDGGAKKKKQQQSTPTFLKRQNTVEVAIFAVLILAVAAIVFEFHDTVTPKAAGKLKTVGSTTSTTSTTATTATTAATVDEQSTDRRASLQGGSQQPGLPIGKTQAGSAGTSAGAKKATPSHTVLEDDSDSMALFQGVADSNVSVANSFALFLKHAGTSCTFPGPMNPLSDRDLKLLKINPQLTELSLNKQKALSDNCVPYILAEPLTKLGLISTKLTNRGLEQIADKLGSTLETLNIANTKVTSIDCLTRLPLLSRLDINSMPALRKHWATMPALSTLTDLCAGNRTFDDQTIAYVTRLPALRHLTLADDQISDRGAQVLSQCKNLRDVDLYRLDITDKTLDRLKDLPLVRMKIACTQVSAQGVERLITRVKTLKFIEVSPCEKISASQVSELKLKFAGRCVVE